MEDGRANVELKCRYPDREKAIAACQRLGAELEHVERQVDTYFAVGGYRMKLRESSLGQHWMIGYSRPNEPGSRKSSYRLESVPDPEAKKRIFAQAMSVKAEVVKERTLYLLGPTRIHIDAVEGLGDFLEFEVVLSDETTEQEGHRIVDDLRREFAVSDEDLISGSYADLVLIDTRAFS